MSQDGMADAPGVQPGFSRRNFIKGVIAAGATVSASAYLFRTNVLGQNEGVAGSVDRLITLDINGQQRRVDVNKNETLAMTLRYKLGLTGTKLGCDRAECGACTVLVDDVPRYSCSTLTHSVRGKKIVSIEGLAAPDGTLHPVQQAVVQGQGFQCAFCMQPGDLLTAIRIPATWAGKGHYFEKVRDRQVWDFALVNIAASMNVSGSTIGDARMVVNGVAATPYRLNAVEAFIKGKARDKATADQAADIAVQGAVPLQHNAYKIPLMKALVKRAIRGDAEWTS